MYKLADLVDYPDVRLERLFVRPVGRRLWAVSKVCDCSGAKEWQTVVSPEILREIGVDLARLGDETPAAMVGAVRRRPSPRSRGDRLRITDSRI